MTAKPIDILICYPLNEEQLKVLSAISPRIRLSIHSEGEFEDIPTDIIKKAEVMLTSKSVPLPDAAPELRWIQFSYAGIDFIKDHPLFSREDFIATTLSGANATKVAEYALMALLALGHKLPMMIHYQDKKIWPPDRWRRFKAKELRGSTVGLLGYGSIARELARLLQPFDVKILAIKNNLENLSTNGFTPEGTGDPEGIYFDRLYPPEAVHSVIKKSDYVVVSLPLTETTKNIINSREFELMKTDAYLVSLGRGGQVNETALLHALREKQIAGAVLDVFNTEPLPQDNPLWTAPNLVITPHIAGNTDRYNDMVVELFKENLHRYLANEELLNIFHPERGY